MRSWLTVVGGIEVDSSSAVRKRDENKGGKEREWERRGEDIGGRSIVRCEQLEALGQCVITIFSLVLGVGGETISITRLDHSCYCDETRFTRLAHKYSKRKDIPGRYCLVGEIFSSYCLR
jgi:hypothetical protein